MEVGRLMDFETFLEESVTGKRTGIGTVARRAFDALRSVRAKFALVGAVALGVRAKERFTRDLDILVDPTKWKAATRAMFAAGFRENPDWGVDEVLGRFIDPKTRLGIDLMFGVGDPEESTRRTARVRTVFGMRIPVARSEYLLWMYLNSDQPRHHADAVDVLRYGKPDLKKLRLELKVAGDLSALSRLSRLEVEAKKPRGEEGWRLKEHKRRAKSEEE